MSPVVADGRALKRADRLRHLYRWHWISAAVSLVGLLMFAITGFTLNHAADIEARPVVVTASISLPDSMRERLWGSGSSPSDDETRAPASDSRPLPQAFDEWLANELGVNAGGRAAEWSDAEIYLSLPRPGGDAWLRVDREAGEIEYERTDRGWIAWLNDLHKGRHAGTAWALFIDLFALACVVFAITGLLILAMHARNRPLAWPMLALGALIPTVVVLLFVH